MYIQALNIWHNITTEYYLKQSMKAQYMKRNSKHFNSDACNRARTRGEKIEYDVYKLVLIV